MFNPEFELEVCPNCGRQTTAGALVLSDRGQVGCEECVFASDLFFAAK